LKLTREALYELVWSEPIVLTPEAAADLRIVAELVAVLG
jgi:hypothetical protein